MGRRESRTGGERVAGRVAGGALLVMAVVAGVGLGGALPKVRSLAAGTSGSTTDLSSGAVDLVALVLVCVAGVVVLDVVVAWTLHAALRHAGARLSALVAMVRTVYAAGFAAAALHLLAWWRATWGAAASVPALPEALTGFTRTWDAALGVFGLHLIGVGVLLVRQGRSPRWLGAVVLLAGAGYLVDAVVLTAAPDASWFRLGTVTSVGEVLLALWLVRPARRGSGQAPHVGHRLA